MVSLPRQQDQHDNNTTYLICKAHYDLHAPTPRVVGYVLVLRTVPIVASVDHVPHLVQLKQPFRAVLVALIETYQSDDCVAHRQKLDLCMHKKNNMSYENMIAWNNEQSNLFLTHLTWFNAEHFSLWMCTVLTHVKKAQASLLFTVKTSALTITSKIDSGRP
jgi:hypothetical protein